MKKQLEEKFEQKITELVDTIHENFIGEKGKDATINGHNAITIKQGEGIKISERENEFTISAEKKSDTLTTVSASEMTLALTKDKNQILLEVPEGFQLKLPSVQTTENVEIHLFMIVGESKPSIMFPAVSWQNAKTPDIKQNMTYELIFTSISNGHDITWLGGVLEYGSKALAK